jgi:hypothetical protein
LITIDVSYAFAACHVSVEATELYNARSLEFDTPNLSFSRGV